jgi:hypothetical protein
MKAYNIFYKNYKLNNLPINQEKLDKMLKNCKNNMVKIVLGSDVKDVPLDSIKIIKCTIV